MGTVKSIIKDGIGDNDVYYCGYVTCYASLLNCCWYHADLKIRLTNFGIFIIFRRLKLPARHKVLLVLVFSGTYF